MKNKIYLTLLIAVTVLTSIKAQSQPKNLLQIKTNLYYFKGSTVKFNHIAIPFNLVYSRFLKDKPFFLGGNFSDFWSYYDEKIGNEKKGDVVARVFITMGVHGGYRVQMTPKRTLLAKVGLAYRMGYENQFFSRIQLGQNRYETFNTQYKYRNPGFEFSAEQQFHLSTRWSLSLGGGYQYFLSRATTNHHLWVNAGAGYLF